MGRNARHIASGIEAVIPNVSVVTPYDVWVPKEHLPKAIRFVVNERGVLEKPEVYVGQHEEKVCLRL